jgi:glycerol transport system ATP-binding protein
MAARLAQAGNFTVGVRPEFLAPCPAGTAGALRVAVRRVQDVGTYALLTVDLGGKSLHARMDADTAPRSGDNVWLPLLNPHTCFYRDEELIR